MNILCFPTCPGVAFGDMAWCAVNDDYDADCDQDGYFSTSPVGYGASKTDAIGDLEEQLTELERDGDERCELGDPYEAAGESPFGLPGGGGL